MRAPSSIPSRRTAIQSATKTTQNWINAPPTAAPWGRSSEVKVLYYSFLFNRITEGGGGITHRESRLHSNSPTPPPPAHKSSLNARCCRHVQHAVAAASSARGIDKSFQAPRMLSTHRAIYYIRGTQTRRYSRGHVL